ncbi:MAG: hypothetical protein QNJ40_23500 [Xanthomonadales bacterium]|nr:hypothetical protein [Xanthomonadales bacterium]
MSDKSDSMAKLAAVLGAVATVLVAINTWQVSQFETDFRQVESERELNFRIYQSIAESIESGNPQRIRAVRALVDALASEDLRDSFLSALETGEVQIYESQQAVPAGGARTTDAVREKWGDWDYDIFWCSSSGSAAESQANAIVAAIQGEGAEGRIRARVLPDSIRATGSYSSLQDYEIRYEESERKRAEAVGAIAERTISIPGSFNLREIAPLKPTPWYISVFICPEATETAA